MVDEQEDEYLLLKWGTLKGWNVNDKETQGLLREYFDYGVSAGAMSQKDTAEQKALICKIIDRIDGEIQNDWSGDILTKEDAKKYVMEYST